MQMSRLLNTWKAGEWMDCPFCCGKDKKILSTSLMTTDITTGERKSVEMCEECVKATIALFKEEQANGFEKVI